MRSLPARPALAPVYRKALKTWRPVILYFGNEYCPACGMAEPVFRQIAAPYKDQARIYVLNTSETPRHPDVTCTPTVLFYKEGKLLKKLKGIGKPDTLAEDFAWHIGRLRPKAAVRKAPHDVAWLRRRLSGLCMVPRARCLVGG